MTSSKENGNNPFSVLVGHHSNPCAGLHTHSTGRVYFTMSKIFVVPEELASASERHSSNSEFE